MKYFIWRSRRRVGAQMQAAEREVVRVEREIAVLREKIIAAEQALPANLKDQDEA